jgi:hypothetical protein
LDLGEERRLLRRSFAELWGRLLTTFTIYQLAGAVIGRMPRATSRTTWNRIAVLPVLLYSWYAVKYMMPQPIAPLRLVAVFAMGFPGLLARGAPAPLSPEGAPDSKAAIPSVDAGIRTVKIQGASATSVQPVR